MSVYKRGATYWVRITAPGGQRIRQSAQTTSKQAAQEYHDNLKAELWRVYKLGEKPRRTWQEAAVRWASETEGKADHRHDVAKLRWLHQFLGHLYLDEVSRDLIDEIASKKRKTAAPATANRYLALIRSVLRAARDDWEWLDSIPRVHLSKEPPGRIRWLTREEAQRLIRELPEHLASMATFSLATGLRRSNVTQLRWEHVNLAIAQAWVPAELSKTGVAISVPLNQAALAVLTKQVGKNDEYVFVYRNKPVEQTSTKAWYAALKRADITNFKWHDLRHTWASWHVQSGTPLQELMDLGGWKTYKTVLRYAHLGGRQLSTAAKRIDGIL